MKSTIDFRELTFGDIGKINDITALSDLVEELSVAAQHIFAQLEFPNDDQTDAWERRTIAALANRRAQLACAQRRLDRLTGNAKNNERAERELTDAMRAQTRATEELARAERHTATALEHRAAQVKKILHTIRQFNSDSAWRDAAYQILDAETRDRITALMLSRAEAGLKALVPADALEATTNEAAE